MPKKVHETAIWAIDKIKPYERNPRKHPKKQIEELRASFREYGQVWPVLVRSDGTLIAGHGRLEAAKAEGFAEIRVIVADGWSDAQCRAFGILDNQVALNSEWDEDLLSDELASMKGIGIDVGALGFDLTSLNALLPNLGGMTHPDAKPTAGKAQAKPGDLWRLGEHRLLCGDPTNAKDVTRVLAGTTPNLTIADFRPIDWPDAVRAFPGAIAYVWHTPVTAKAAGNGLTAQGFTLRSQIVQIQRGKVGRYEPCWYAVKGKGAWEGDRKQTTIWEAAKAWTIPVACVARSILNHTVEGDHVYAANCGPGSAFIAGESTGRKIHGIEFDPVEVDEAIWRWEAFTGSKAKRSKT